MVIILYYDAKYCSSWVFYVFIYLIVNCGVTGDPYVCIYVCVLMCWCIIITIIIIIIFFFLICHFNKGIP
jgi:hypothetical protein